MDVNEYNRSNQSFLHLYNVRKVLSLLRKYNTLSRIDLSTLGNLDKKTVTNIVRELLENKQIIDASQVSNGVGRPKSLVKLNGAFSYVLGLDLGGTHISGIILDFAGNVLSSKIIDLTSAMLPDTIINISNYLIGTLLEKAGLSLENLSGIGISIPGFIDKKSGRTIMSENLPMWKDVPIVEIYTKEYGMEVFIDDCSRLMALAEMTIERKCKDCIIMDIGLGIGCGIVINRKIYSGFSGKSGEIGHMNAIVDGPQCTCGRKGCIESISSGWAIAKQAEEAVKSGASSMLRTLKSAASPIPKDVVLAAGLGDEFSRELLIDAGRYLGIGIANSINLFNPEKVIIGGRLIKDNPLFYNSIIKTIEQFTMPDIFEGLHICPSQIGDLASAIGAATLCHERYFENPFL